MSPGCNSKVLNEVKRKQPKVDNYSTAHHTVVCGSVALIALSEGGVSEHGKQSKGQTLALFIYYRRFE